MHLCKNVFKWTKHIITAMTNRKTHLVLAAAIAAAAIVSCKKDDSTASLPYLDGTLSLDFDPSLPAYILADDHTEYTITPKGASHPEGLGIGYQWRVTPSDNDSYTVSKEEDGEGDGVFTYDFAEYNKDTLRTLTVSCEAFAEGYSSLSASYYVTVVAPWNEGKGSIQRAGYTKGGTTVLYDGVEYLTYEAPDSRTWMKQNLAYDGSGTEKVGAPYQDAEAMSQVFGRFYTWDEATGGISSNDGTTVQGICPDGWHIPSDNEWTDLAEATMAGIYKDAWRDGLEDSETGLEYGIDWSRGDYRISKEFMAGEMLDPDLPDTDEDYDNDINYGKEARSATFNTDTELWPYLSYVGDPTNRSGISAIPAGYALMTNGMWNYGGVFEYAIFWTSTEDPDTGKAICRVINNESPVVYRDGHDKATFAASVRCVKD